LGGGVRGDVVLRLRFYTTYSPFDSPREGAGLACANTESELMALTCFQTPQSQPHPAIITGLATVPSCTARETRRDHA